MKIWICRKDNGKVIFLSLAETLKKFNLKDLKLRELINSGKEYNGYFFDEAI